MQTPFTFSQYSILEVLGEGTYGSVHRAISPTGEEVAIKKVKAEIENRDEGIPINTLREIELLKQVKSSNVISLKDVILYENITCLVLEHGGTDLAKILDGKLLALTEGYAKGIVQQLLRGVDHLHSLFIVHRDLKPSNILYKDGVIKICDFGLARRCANPSRRLTPCVMTLWYRAPEVILGTEKYSFPVDIWSCGCIAAELLTGTPLLAGVSEIDQFSKISSLLGSPSDEEASFLMSLPKSGKVSLFSGCPANAVFDKVFASKNAAQFISALLSYLPEKRSLASQALRQPYFEQIPFPTSAGCMPMGPLKSKRKTPRSDPVTLLEAKVGAPMVEAQKKKRRKKKEKERIVDLFGYDDDDI